MFQSGRITGVRGISITHFDFFQVWKIETRFIKARDGLYEIVTAKIKNKTAFPHLFED